MTLEHHNLIVHAKKKAKQLQKKSPDKIYNHCLNEVAQELGYLDFFHLKQHENVNRKPCFVESNAELIKDVLGRCIVDVIDQPLRFADEESQQNIVPELWGLLFSTITNESDLEKIDQLTRWKIDKEKLKGFGNTYLAPKVSDNDIIVGNILLSMSHYYRSLMDNCAHKIGEHINFKEYFGYWLKGFGQGEKVVTKLCKVYPYYGNSGGTSWRPGWWYNDVYLADDIPQRVIEL